MHDLEKEKCPTCGHRIGPGRIRFNANLARLFVISAQLSLKSIPQRFNVAMLKARGMSVEYTIVAKLKYFGIIEQPYELRRQGVYQITEEGWDFLRGVAEVPKWVEVERMNVTDRAPERISLQMALDQDWFEQQDWIMEWRKAYPKRKDAQLTLGV